MVKIGLYNNETERQDVIDLWTDIFGYPGARNNPQLVLDKKKEVGDDLLYVAKISQSVVGTIMAGYDGHRGWIYSLAVSDDHRMNNIGTLLLKYAEKQLEKRGCVKINLQILPSNQGVKDFYIKNGYAQEERISMGKEIPSNIPGDKI